MGTFSRQRVTFGEVGPSFASLLADLFAPFWFLCCFPLFSLCIFPNCTAKDFTRTKTGSCVFHFNSSGSWISHFDCIFDSERGGNMNQRVLICVQGIYSDESLVYYFLGWYWNGKKVLWIRIQAFMSSQSSCCHLIKRCLALLVY